MLLVLATLCLTLNFLKARAQEQKSLYEDQFILCNFKNVCQLINIDDYINKQNSSKLWHNFNNDLDTFNLSEIDP